MSQLNRRGFVGAMLASAAVASRPAGAQQVVADGQRSATDLVELGQTGVRVSRLGLGTGVHGWNQQSNATRMGPERFLPLMKAAYDRGITFFDLADLYGTHDYMKVLLAQVPREKVQIQSKIWFNQHGVPEKLTNAVDTVKRFLGEVGTDYLDSVLLHCTTADDWTTQLAPSMEQLEAARQQGLIRSHGTSCHSRGALDAALASPWTQVQQARVNHTGAKMDGKPAEIAELLRAFRAAGKGVVGMKLVGEGDFKERSEREAALRFVVEEKCVDAVVIGMESIEHLDEAIASYNAALAL